MTTSNAFVPQRYVHAAMLLCITNMAALLWMPSLLGALAQGFGLVTADLSKLASFELVGFVLGTVFTSSKSIGQLHRWVFIGCGLVIAANIVLALYAPTAPFIVMRPLAGLGGGLGFGYALKVCTASEHPTKSFGLLTGLMSIMMIVGFQAIAWLIGTKTGADGVVDADSVKTVARMVFGIYAAFSAFALAVYVTNRAPAPADDAASSPAQTKASGMPPPIVLIGLLAIVLSFMGQGSIWAFLQTLGTAHGFSVGGVANAMSAWAILGVIGSFSVAALPHHLPRWMAIGVAMLVLYAGLYALYAPQSLIWYVVGCGIGGFYWNFALPLMLGLLARVDHTGRGSVLGGTMSSLGGAIGPMLASMVIQGNNYQPVGWMSGVLCLAGLICVFVVERRGHTFAA